MIDYGLLITSTIYILILIIGCIFILKIVPKLY